MWRRLPFEGDPESSRYVAHSEWTAPSRLPVRAPEVVGENAWMDAALFKTAGIPTVVFGPAGGGYHAAVEWVEVASVVHAARILAATIVDVL